MKHFRTLADMHRDNGWPPPEHPMISLIGCNKDCPIGDREFTSDMYMLTFKKLRAGVIMYGHTPYDHSNGSMMFVKPRQIIQMNDLELEEAGFMILIHEDFLHGHALHQIIQKYGYFDYEVNEALHLSPKEEQIVWELHEKISIEYYNNPDEFSKEIMLGHLASILMYAQRFYRRQFIHRKELSGKMVTKFTDALNVHFERGHLQAPGLPSVNQIASQLNVSPRYLTDLLKQETGKTALDLIHMSLISEAKNLLRAGDNGVAQIAYKLGFENTSYFTRLFKKQTGIKPLDFKKMILN